MEDIKNSGNFTSINEQEDQELKINSDDEDIEKLITSLPREKWSGRLLIQYNGIWCPSHAIHGMIFFQKHFQAEDDDIILASLPKSGTSWLAALVFSIVNRNRYTSKDSPLLTTRVQDLVPGLGIQNYHNEPLPQNFDQLSRPRIFATHAHYQSLPNSIKSASNSRIVYVCRNPLDNFVSLWHFVSSLKSQTGEARSIEESFIKYCQGVHAYGPFWDSIFGYWKASREKPENVLFLTYEDLKEDLVFHLKKLAMFLRFPFTIKEEEQGLIEEISRLCSFGNLKNLEVNQDVNGHKSTLIFPLDAYFRKGNVGDYVNHLSPSMIEDLNRLTKEKFDGSGIVFNQNEIKVQKKFSANE